MSQDGMADAPGVQPGVSRRNFIKGVIAAGATVSASAYLFRTDDPRPERRRWPGAVERLITLDVNGQQRRVDVLKNETLAMTLRYKLGLTGTKLGCDRAECGACTVLVDDVPHYSCSMLTHSVRGKKIVSIEGLAEPDGTLHPVQQAVVEGQGFQCAFCMPGFVMATAGFLKTNPNPTRAAARARHLRQPVPLRRLQQDSRLHDARSRTVEGGVIMAEQQKPVAPASCHGRAAEEDGIQAPRPQLPDARPGGEGHRQSEVRRRLPRRRHGVHQADAEPAAARARFAASMRAPRSRCPACTASSPRTICRRLRRRRQVRRRPPARRAERRRRRWLPTRRRRQRPPPAPRRVRATRRGRHAGATSRSSGRWLAPRRSGAGRRRRPPPHRRRRRRRCRRSSR